jgi:aminoglycoside 3-N-acetyltransferase
VTEPDTDLPRTRESLTRDLRDLGVRAGSVLLVHSSMRSLGWVAGGAQAVAQALLDAVTERGTVVVPTHTPDNSDPAGWHNPPVPPSWWPVIRAHMPGFDPAVTPSRWMGRIAEVVRTWPGAHRSTHPQVSFAAIGPLAEPITAGHALDEMLGEHSPLSRVYEFDGEVLLLGVGHDSNTSLHLAEYRVPDPPRSRQGAAVLTPDGGREWIWWEDVDLHEGDFARLGADLDEDGEVVIGPVGSAESRLMRQRSAVDFAVGWMPIHRGRPATSTNVEFTGPTSG